MTTYTNKTLTQEARRAVKHAECLPCQGASAARILTRNVLYLGWELHLGNGSGHPALVAFYVCKAGHATQTNIAI